MAAHTTIHPESLTMKSPFLATLLCTMMIATTLTVFSAEVKNPVEIGDVRWGRDLPTALAQSASSGKPVLVLFQEVPGCAGCQKFGRDVLRTPSWWKPLRTSSCQW